MNNILYNIQTFSGSFISNLYTKEKKQQEAQILVSRSQVIIFLNYIK